MAAHSTQYSHCSLFEIGIYCTNHKCPSHTAIGRRTIEHMPVLPCFVSTCLPLLFSLSIMSFAMKECKLTSKAQISGEQTLGSVWSALQYRCQNLEHVSCSSAFIALVHLANQKRSIWN